MIIINWNSYYIVAIIPSLLIAIGTFFLTKTEKKDKIIGIILLFIGVWTLLFLIINILELIFDFTSHIQFMIAGIPH